MFNFSKLFAFILQNYSFKLLDSYLCFYKLDVLVNLDLALYYRANYIKTFLNYEILFYN